MVSSIHSKLTIRSEIAKCRRNSCTLDLWPRRRKIVTIVTTNPLPMHPISAINPKEKKIEKQLGTERPELGGSPLLYLAIQRAWSYG